MATATETTPPDEDSVLVSPPDKEAEGLVVPPQNSRRKNIACFCTAVLFAVVVGWHSRSVSTRTGNAPALLEATRPKCMFCDQSPPELHDERSYTLTIEGAEVLVTPMTVTYNYELYDGQNLFTDARAEKVPNLAFDYAVLGIAGARNLRRGTNESVSLDEVYLHHLNYFPLSMLGAEILTHNADAPFMRFPDGYAFHVDVGQTPEFGVNAHLLSNRDLAPIDGSLPLARKRCNECFYAPGKGADCTPALSGTFRCCGDSPACLAGEVCACATRAGSDPARTTKYRLQVEFLVSRDLGRFKRVDQWNMAAPSCHLNQLGEAAFEEYSQDNFCFDKGWTYSGAGGGALFHQIPENNAHPHVHTRVNLLAPAGGRLVWAAGHLHTGGVNVTLRVNGEAVCAAGAVYGTDDGAANARNERNHLIGIEPCAALAAAPVHFERGDVFTTESVYYGGVDDARLIGAGAGGEHKNVMSMMFLGVVFEGTSDYLTKNRTSFSRWNDFVHIAD